MLNRLICGFAFLLAFVFVPNPYLDLEPYPYIDLEPNPYLDLETYPYLERLPNIIIMEPRQMRKLDSIQKQIDAISTFIRPYCTHDADLKKLTSRTIETKLKSLSHYDTRYHELYEELYQVAETDAELNELTAALDAFVTKCTDTESELEHLRKRLNPQPEPENQQRDNGNRQNHNSQVRLPKLSLKEFHGGYIEWPEFYDLFKTSVDSRTDLTGSQKLSYLKSVLKGEPASLVTSLKLTDENYEIAIKSLCDRYDDTAAIRDALFEKLLFSLEHVKKQTAHGLRTFASKINEYVQLLKNLGEPTEHWDSILIFLLKKKLDSETRKEWEKHIADKDDPDITLNTLLDFLNTTSRSLENVAEPNSGSGQPVQTNPPKRQSNPPSGGTSGAPPFRPSYYRPRNQYPSDNFVGAFLGRPEPSYKCHLCGKSHVLRSCQQFLSMTVPDRRAKVANLGLCINCFSKFHDIELCDKPPSCRLCPNNGARHHPTLHLHQSDLPVNTQSGFPINRLSETVNTGHVPSPGERDPTQAHLGRDPGQSSSASENSTDATVIQLTMSTKQRTTDEVLLATAIVNIGKSDGTFEPCRALIDSGSQSCTVTTDCAQRLKAKIRRIPKREIIGIGDSKTECSDKMAALALLPNGDRSEPLQVEALVMSKITGVLPRRTAMIAKDLEFPGIELADPGFHSPGRIDILLGADVYCEIMRTEKPLKQYGLFLQSTIFGWIITGGGKGTSESTRMNCLFDTGCRNRTATTSIDDDSLKRFWEMDQVISNPWSLEEKMCEKFYEDTHQRQEDGRYVVALPFRDSVPDLGDSKRIALRRFSALERKLDEKPEIGVEYRKSIQEYLDLGHAELAPDIIKNTSECFYMPHHPVIKETSSTTKVRPVFDASAKTTSGTSLNERLMVGPKVQQDLFPIITRFRKHPVAFSADIEKMYRQVRLRTEDRDYHRFIWREPSTGQLKDYRMTSVTFGVASSAHHATRTLKQLVSDENQRYPLATRMIQNDTYVDDLLSGASDLETAKLYQEQVINALSTGGFRLRKWSSNRPQLLQAIPEEDRENNSPLNLVLDENEPGNVVKPLGVQWHPDDDVISYSVRPPLLDIESDWTKRQMLSEMSRVFDPCGLLAPTILVAKILFQKSWIAGLEWDDKIPDDMMNQWKSWRADLISLDHCKYDRCLVPDKPVKDYQLHGFCDASEAAYGAVGYLRTETVDGEIFVRLVASKTKVAPVKKISIPRLELSACHLLANLMDSVERALELTSVTKFAWSDSTIALCWIKGEPSKWKTFVANRVSEIQDVVCPSSWRHIATDQNPADCISRGIMPAELSEYRLWWYGPEFLIDNFENWPRFATPHIDDSERNLVHSESKVDKTTIHVTMTNSSLFEMFDYSDFSKIIRVTAWCLRARLRKEIRPTGVLTPDEISYATKVWIRNVQVESYSSEISILKSDQPLPRKHHLLPLSPFVADDGILRVGGRIRESELDYEAKHQALLPKDHRFTELLIDDLHRRNLHAAPKLLLATIRQRFWIINGYQIIRKFARNCVICKRWKHSKLEQIMGDLPSDRVRPSRAFQKAGVDYAGPILIKDKLGRGCRKIKAWLCYFVCFTTKACHLEAVTSLSTDAFLAAYRRFCSRRGRPTDLYSDNATNFHGADNELRDFLTSVHTNDIFSYSLAQDGIQWHFSPQRSSHFGGLYEAGVKSMKYHLYRTLSNSTLTYEELTTLLCQIEACLNSRPLTALSSDPNDFSALTPGHFLVGGPLNSLPGPDLVDVKLNRLSRWQLVQRFCQDLWNRWSNEYLHTLQTRGKWTRATENLKIDDLVLIMDENSAPLKWPMARVLEVFPGRDGKVRVATLKTQSSVFKRPIVKLVPLLIEDQA